MWMKRKRTIRKKKKKKKKKRNCLEMFEKRSETKFPTRRHYCRFSDRKKWTIQMLMKSDAFYCLYSHLSGSLTTNRCLWLGWKFSKLCDTSNCIKIWIRSYLAPCKQCPSKLIAFCNQSTKSATSNFYAGFRNSLPVLVQLLSPASKATIFHNCPPSVSY